MATAKKAAAGTAASSVSLVPEDPKTPRPRLHKLIVKNFRAIGPKPVEIELDDIVVLVGPNNAGKSSILRAYDVAMKQGSAEGKLQIEDFPSGKVLAAALPEIELQTIVFDNAPGDRWLAPTADGEWLIREQWVRISVPLSRQISKPVVDVRQRGQLERLHRHFGFAAARNAALDSPIYECADLRIAELKRLARRPCPAPFRPG